MSKLLRMLIGDLPAAAITKPKGWTTKEWAICVGFADSMQKSWKAAIKYARTKEIDTTQEGMRVLFGTWSLKNFVEGWPIRQEKFDEYKRQILSLAHDYPRIATPKLVKQMSHLACAEKNAFDAESKLRAESGI